MCLGCRRLVSHLLVEDGGGDKSGNRLEESEIGLHVGLLSNQVCGRPLEGSLKDRVGEGVTLHNKANSRLEIP